MNLGRDNCFFDFFVLMYFVKFFELLLFRGLECMKGKEEILDKLYKLEMDLIFYRFYLRMFYWFRFFYSR